MFALWLCLGIEISCGGYSCVSICVLDVMALSGASGEEAGIH